MIYLFCLLCLTRGVVASYATLGMIHRSERAHPLEHTQRAYARKRRRTQLDRKDPTSLCRKRTHSKTPRHAGTCNSAPRGCLQENARLFPKVGPSLPIQPLGRPNGRTQSKSSWARVQSTEVRPQKPPSAVNHLRARLHSQLRAIWKDVLCQSHVHGLFPNPLLANLHPFLAVSHTVVHDARDAHLVGPGAVGVKHNFASLQPRRCQRPPIRLLDGPRPRGPLAGLGGSRLHQHQCIRTLVCMTQAINSQPPLESTETKINLSARLWTVVMGCDAQHVFSDQHDLKQ